MELAIPHVVVRICGPGVGRSLVTALGVHPVEITEARDASEARRVALERPTVLVVITDPPDAHAAIAETCREFPQTPILLVVPAVPGANASEPAPVTHGTGSEQGWIDSIACDLPLPDICWHVMETVSRASRLTSLTEHPMGPVLLEVDDHGLVISSTEAIVGVQVDGHRARAGASILDLIQPADRGVVANMLGRAQAGEAQFSTVRMVDEHGSGHVVSVGVRHLDAGRCALLVQPLISGGLISGRRGSKRDPITGLLTRWAMYRELESRARLDADGFHPVVLILKLDNFSAISEYIGHEATDVVLVRVASAMNQFLAYPAICSRVMGDTFLACLPEGGIDAAVHSAEQVIQGVNAIDMPGFSAGFHLRASVGITAVSRSDYDFAIRLANAAATEACTSGATQPIVAGVPFTSADAEDLAAAMDLGSWEVWLQPVVERAGGRAMFHEALARFGNGHGRVLSRPEFFAAGRAQGLLERFDGLVLHRVIQILAAHPDTKFSVNVSFETFMSDAFPAAFLEPMRAAPGGCERIILEISPHCLAMPAAGVRSRLESLAAAGVAVAIDDFGSGICRPRYLTQYPLAIVKLDALVTGYVDDDPLQREFVRTVVNLCRARGITTVAEYTRSPEQMERLAADGVDWFQGELIGMPAPAADVLPMPTVGAAAG